MPASAYVNGVSQYLAGLVSYHTVGTFTAYPKEGIDVPVLSKHHEAALSDQLAAHRGYPQRAPLTAGIIGQAGAIHTGAFISPPDARSMRIGLQVANAQVDPEDPLIITATYNSQAKSATVIKFAAGIKWVQVFLGPWNLAQVNGDSPSLAEVAFTTSDGSSTIAVPFVNLYATFDSEIVA